MMSPKTILVVMGMIGCAIALNFVKDDSVTDLPVNPRSGLAIHPDTNDVIPVVLIAVAEDGGPIVVVDADNVEALKQAGTFYLVKHLDSGKTEAEMTAVTWEKKLGEHKGMTVVKGVPKAGDDFVSPTIPNSNLDYDDYAAYMTQSNGFRVAYFTLSLNNEKTTATLHNQTIDKITAFGNTEEQFKADDVPLTDIPEGSGIFGKEGLLGFLVSPKENKITAAEAELMKFCNGK